VVDLIRFVRSLLRAEVKEYLDAGHAFLKVHGGTLGWVMARIGMRLHEAWVTDVQARILGFFDRPLH